MTVDELCARELLDRLAGAEPPPSRVDVRLARHRGRRMLFWRRAGAPGASALAVVAVTALISSNLITLGPQTHLSGPLHPPAALSPYATFGWLPAGFTLSAGSAVNWWGTNANFSSSPGRIRLDTVTAQNTQVSAGSVTGRTITLTVNTENDCKLGSSAGVISQRMLKALRKKSPHWHLPPYQLWCNEADGGRGDLVGPVSGEVNGSPAYGGGGGLAWKYAKGSWAQLQLRAWGAVSAKEWQALNRTWTGSQSSATKAMLLRIADHIRFGERGESFAFKMSGVPTTWHQYATSYAEYGGRMINTSLWLGPGPASDANAAQIAVTPASKPTSCGSIGDSNYLTLDGTRFTVSTMQVPINGDLEGDVLQQVLCGYVAGLQVNVGVSLQALHSGLSSLIGTNIQSPAVTLFRHMTLLGPNPSGWTTQPLG
jgi:hypothetical protein